MMLMVKRKPRKRAPHDLKGYNLTRAAGEAFDTKLFPGSKPGSTEFLNGPKDQPRVYPKAPADFAQWFRYYQRLVGTYVSVLNGLQFDFDLEEKPADRRDWQTQIPHEMARLLDSLYRRILLGQAPHADDPQKLIWPLGGVYYFRHLRLPDWGDYHLELRAFFESEATTRACVNCVVELELAVGAAIVGHRAFFAAPPPITPISSSSYLATSSSSDDDLGR